LAGITIVNSFAVFMDAYPLFVDGQIRQAGIDPAARVVIVNAVALDVDGFMGVTTKDAGGAVLVRVRQGSGRHFQRHPQPARVEAVNQSGNRLASQVELLQAEIKSGSEGAESYPVHLKAIELVAMDRQVEDSAEFPLVFL